MCKERLENIISCLPFECNKKFYKFLASDFYTATAFTMPKSKAKIHSNGFIRWIRGRISSMPHWMVKMYGESVRVYDPVLLIEIMKNVAICTALQFIFVAFVFRPLIFITKIVCCAIEHSCDWAINFWFFAYLWNINIIN